MIIDEMTAILTQLFGETVQQADDTWQVEVGSLRLLVLVSTQDDWLRALVPIVDAEAAQPFLAQLMAANFDRTLETRYALHQNVLWGVFQHSLVGLTSQDFTDAIGRLALLHQQGLEGCFQELVEQRVRQIIQTAKQQGQSLASTLQTLDRFYQEGLLGNLTQTTQSRDATLAAWRFQLERLWDDTIS